jgi:glutaconate CoA-transferase subunit B
MSPPRADPRFLVQAIVPLLAGTTHVAVGNASPIPAAAALAARRLGGGRPRVTLLGSLRHTSFTDGARELFDCAGQGRIDAFFLGGGQIDGRGNINLVGTGGYPASQVRFPGSFGSAYLAFVVPRVILFREEHSPRVMVPAVDFISAPGWSPPGIHRPGGPTHLLTGLCLFTFDRVAGRFTLASTHPGIDAADVRRATGFDYDAPVVTPTTPGPDAATVEAIDAVLREDLPETYPGFAAALAA